MVIDLKELFGLSSEEFNQRMVQSIIESIKERSLDGFDYLRFKHSVINLMKLDMSETIAIKSALTTAASMGMDQEKITGTIAHYEGILQSEMVKSTDALRNQITKNIDEVREAANELDKQKEENLRKIEQLQRQNEAIVAKAQELRTEAAQNESKIVHTREEFKKICDNVQQQFDIDKVTYKNLLL